MVEKNTMDEDLQGTPVDATLYCGLIRTLMYLTSSRPDLIYAVCLCARYPAKPTKKHLNAVKWIFRYLNGTINMGLIMNPQETQQVAARDEKCPRNLDALAENSMNSPELTLSSRPTIVEVPKELPKVSMVNTSLNKLKHHLAGFEVVVKERTMPIAITEGSWGFEHTKACFRDEIIPFVKVLKDLSNTFDQYLIDELSEVQNLFHQMEQAVEQHHIVNIIVNSSMDDSYVNTHECEKCLKLEIGLLNKKDFVEKEIYDKLFKSFTTFEKHCISLEVDTQLNQEIFQRDNSVSNQSAPSFDQFFKLNELKAQPQEKDTVIKKLKERIKSLILKDDLQKLKGKALVDNDITKHPSDPKMLKTDEEAAVLRDLVDHIKANYPLDHTLDSAYRYTRLIQELLTNISKTCPSINNTDGKLVTMTPKNKDKRVRFTEPVTSSGHTITKTASTSNLVSNKPMFSSTGVKSSTSASGSQPSGNTKKDKIQQTSSSTQKNKHSKLNANSELKCVKCNGCMLSDNHDLCVLDFINNVNARVKSKSVKKSSKKKVWKPTGKVFTNIGYIWRPTGRTFTIVGNACPLTRITTTTKMPLRKPTALENETPKPVVTLVYLRKPRKFKTNVPFSKFKVVQIVLWYLDSDCSKHMTGDRSQLTNFVNKFLGTVKFGNDHVAKILGYGDYQIGNVTISRVYYIEGLGHNLFLVGYDASFPICLLSKASKTKSWLWHICLSHLNFGAINHLARHGLVRGLPKLKFEKDHLCSACAMGKSKKKPHKPKSEDTNQEKLYHLHMDLCGPLRVASVN
ncbi:retrovirus-related pol polyprotein from transposon TNT 1-94 [Tanacetum coccineum]